MKLIDRVTDLFNGIAPHKYNVHFEVTKRGQVIFRSLGHGLKTRVGKANFEAAYEILDLKIGAALKPWADIPSKVCLLNVPRAALHVLMHYEAESERRKSRHRRIQSQASLYHFTLPERLSKFKARRNYAAQIAEAAATKAARLSLKGKGVTVWSDERRRRSTVDWTAILSKTEAAKQCAFERDQTVRAMASHGVTEAEIAIRFGLSANGAKALIARVTRARPAPSPAEKFFAEAEARMIVKSRLEETIRTFAMPPVAYAPRDWLMLN